MTDILNFPEKPVESVDARAALRAFESTGFLVAKACFAVSAFDLVAIAIYWTLATDQRMPWNVAIPTIAAIISVPLLVLSLQWLGRIEAQLSTAAKAEYAALAQAVEAEQRLSLATNELSKAQAHHAQAAADVKKKTEQAKIVSA